MVLIKFQVKVEACEDFSDTWLQGSTVSAVVTVVGPRKTFPSEDPGQGWTTQS